MPDAKRQIPITPELKIGRLLEVYPELEERLIDMSHAFAKLRNPVLRKTVAKVATIQQAARVGGVPLGLMIKTLREAVGQDASGLDESSDPASSANPPEWFDRLKIVDTVDARPLIEAGEQPVTVVMAHLKRLGPGQIFALITPFVPAPLIDLARKQGYEVWSREDSPEVVLTYFTAL